MHSGTIRTVVAALGLFLAAPAAASAQIYSWRDDSGQLVLSNRPKDGTERTYAVAATAGFRSTQPVLTARAQRYSMLITDHAARHGLSPDLVRAVIQAESAFNPNARSVKGAMGLMQLMPATAVEYGVRDAYDPAENIRAGVAYLKSLLVRYDSNEELALAAYNAGPGAVEKYGTVPPYRETRNYVAKIRKSTTGSVPQPPRLYKTIEIRDGREVPKYSNVPSPGAEIVR
jgi:soluble lytic murein transglycosylase-like protein